MEAPSIANGSRAAAPAPGRALNAADILRATTSANGPSEAETEIPSEFPAPSLGSPEASQDQPASAQLFAPAAMQKFGLGRRSLQGNTGVKRGVM